MEAVLSDPKMNSYLQEILPDTDEDFIDKICYYYFYTLEKKNQIGFHTPKITYYKPMLDIRKKKIRIKKSSVVSRDSSPILEASKEESLKLEPKKKSESKLQSKPTDLEIMEIISQLHLDEKYFHLMFDIETLIEKFNENDHYSWKFRTIKGQNYWVNVHTKDSKFDYPYLQQLKSEVSQLIDHQQPVRKKSS